MWFWSCQGTAGGTYTFCSAPNTPSTTPTNGICGSSNGQTLNTIPTTNLCNS